MERIACAFGRGEKTNKGGDWFRWEGGNVASATVQYAENVISMGELGGGKE